MEEKFTQSHRDEILRLKKLAFANGEDITSIENLARIYLGTVGFCRGCASKVAKVHYDLIEWFNSGAFDKGMEEINKINKTIEELGLNEDSKAGKVIKRAPGRPKKSL